MLFKLRKLKEAKEKGVDRKTAPIAKQSSFSHHHNFAHNLNNSFKLKC